MYVGRNKFVYYSFSPTSVALENTKRASAYSRKDIPIWIPNQKNHELSSIVLRKLQQLIPNLLLRVGHDFALRGKKNPFREVLTSTRGNQVCSNLTKPKGHLCTSTWDSIKGSGWAPATLSMTYGDFQLQLVFLQLL